MPQSLTHTRITIRHLPRTLQASTAATPDGARFLATGASEWHTHASTRCPLACRWSRRLNARPAFQRLRSCQHRAGNHRLPPYQAHHRTIETKKPPELGVSELPQRLGTTAGSLWLLPSRDRLANGEHRVGRDDHAAHQNHQRYVLVLPSTVSQQTLRSPIIAQPPRLSKRALWTEWKITGVD